MGRFVHLIVFLAVGFLLASCSTPRSSVNPDHTRNASRSKTAIVKRSPGNAGKPAGPLRKIAASRNTVVAYAQSLVGAKYRYGGADKRGFDCSGFTSHVMGHAGVHIPRTSTLQASGGERIHWKNALPGDLIFFGHGGRINHVGLVTKNRGHEIYVVHSTSSAGVRVDEVRQHPYWSNRILGAATYLDRPSLPAEVFGED